VKKLIWRSFRDFTFEPKCIPISQRSLLGHPGAAFFRAQFSQQLKINFFTSSCHLVWFIPIQHSDLGFVKIQDRFDYRFSGRSAAKTRCSALEMLYLSGRCACAERHRREPIRPLAYAITHSTSPRSNSLRLPARTAPLVCPLSSRAQGAHLEFQLLPQAQAGGLGRSPA
jgi:hypothetical protein